MKKKPDEAHEILHVRLPRDLAHVVRNRAAKQDRPVSNMIRNVLRDVFKKEAA